MPESREHSNLINREKYWSPAYKDAYEKKWVTIRGSKHMVIIATSEAIGEISRDKSGVNYRYEMPCKTVFEGMKLQYGSTDGEFTNIHDEKVVLNKDSSGILIKKKEFVEFLKISDLEIVWTVLGEKNSFSMSAERNYFAVLSGVYYLENNEIVGEINFYDRE